MTTASGRLPLPPLQPRLPLDSDDELVNVARFADGRLNRVSNTAAGPPHDGQAPHQPEIAGRDDDDRQVLQDGSFCTPGQGMLFIVPARMVW